MGPQRIKDDIEACLWAFYEILTTMLDLYKCKDFGPFLEPNRMYKPDLDIKL